MNNIFVQNKDKSFTPRGERYLTHTCINIQKFRFWPIPQFSAVLLDISTNGFKIELVGKMNIKPGKIYTMNIPLHPLGLEQPKKLKVSGRCAWVDHQKHIFGGVFIDLTADQLNTIENILAQLVA